MRFAIAFLVFVSFGKSFQFLRSQVRPTRKLSINTQPQASKKSFNILYLKDTKYISDSLEKKEVVKDYDGREPELSDYIEAIKSWAKDSKNDRAESVAEILQRMESFIDVEGYEKIHPVLGCYEVVIEALAGKKNPSHLETFLFRMEDIWKGSSQKEELSGIRNSYNICLESWANWSNLSKKGRYSSFRALELFRRMKKISKFDPTLGPNKSSYNSILKALSNSGNARESKMILREMEDESALDIEPDFMSYSLVIHSLANSNGGIEAAEQAEAILRNMQQSSNDINSKQDTKPNEFTYEGVINSWGKSRTGKKGAGRAEDLFNEMLIIYQDKRDTKDLQAAANAVVKAWSVCRGGVEAAKRAEFILRRMNPDAILDSNKKTIDIWPNIDTVNAVVSAWAHCGTKDAPYQAERILQEYLEEWNLNVPEEMQIFPTVETYNMIIASHTKTKSKQSARKAEAALYEMINLGASDKGSGKATEKSFGLVISCWSKSSDRFAAERADQLLKVMEENFEKGLSKAKPNIIIYSQVIDAWSKSKNPRAAKKARAIFDKLLEKCVDDKDLRPNTITFNSVLNSLANSHDKEASDDSATLISKMYELKDDPKWDVAPNSRSLISYMACLAKQSKTSPLIAVKVEEQIHRMLNETLSGNSQMEPDSFAFATAINAWVWSGSKDTLTSITRVISLMESLYFKRRISSPPHAICYNTAIRFCLSQYDSKQACAFVSRMEKAFFKGAKEAAPDRLTYAALLNAYAQSNNSNSAELAIQLFRRQQEQARKGNRRAKPHIVCYNTVMACMARSTKPEVRQQGLLLLEEMEKEYRKGNNDAKPDTVTYSTVINILSKSTLKDAGSRAIEILADMERRSRAGDCHVKPNRLTFNAVLNTLSKLQSKAAALKAEELLLKMIKLSTDHPMYSDIKPDLMSYTCVIQAWSDVKVEGAPARAEAILRQLLKAENRIDFSPDIIMYNKVLVSWARSSNGTRADALLQEMENSSSIKPDAFSYKTVLLAWAQQEGGAKKAESILRFMENKFRSGERSMRPDKLCYKAVNAALKKEMQ